MKEKTKPISDITDAAMKNYEHAVRTSLKLQEEAGRLWNSVFTQGNLAQDWQKRFSNVTGIANSLVPLAQNRLEDVMTLLEKNNRTSAELMKKAVDAAQTPTLPESQAKWMDFWTSSVGAVRSNTEAFTEMSNKALDSWVAFVRQNAEVAEIRTGKEA